MKRCAFTVSVVLSALLSFACADPYAYYIRSGSSEASKRKELFSLYEMTNTSAEERFAIIQKISSDMLAEKDYPRLITLLNEAIEKNPDDVYNAHHMLTIAWAYKLQDADDIAALYYDRIIKNYRDLIVSGESIHYTCLLELLRLTADPARRIEYRREIIARFPEKLDMGSQLFLLGTEFEAVGEWKSAMDVYKRFMPYFESTVPGYPDAIQYARTLIDLAAIPKDWTYESLEDLLQAVKSALSSGNSYALTKLRAKVGFFAMDWHQDKDAGNSQVPLNFGAFMSGGRLYHADSLDAASNSREAYLKTWGWTERIATWYLYFRKVNFPADPEIHGRWEWAGIYFGEKMQ